jgi:pimeloyl-ACP methyl ester carboxylesterase
MMRQSASSQRLDLLEGGGDDVGTEHAKLLSGGGSGGGGGGGGGEDSQQPSTRGGNFYPSGSGQLTHYNLSGPSNGRLAVCVHGMTLASYTFTDLSITLTHAGYRVLRYDLFGRGLSSGPPPGAPCNTKTYVAQLELLLQGLGLWAEASHNGVLIGASLGGAIAAAFCAAHRELFSQLVLVAPVGLPVFKLPVLARALDAPFGIGRALSCVLRKCCRRVVGSYVVDMFDGTRWHGALADDVHHHGANNDFVATYMSTLKRFEWTGLKHTVYTKIGENTSREVFCIWGEDDAMVSPRNGAHVREAVPHCTMHVIPNAGHEITIGDTASDKVVHQTLHDLILNFCNGTHVRRRTSPASLSSNDGTASDGGGGGGPGGGGGGSGGGGSGGGSTGSGGSSTSSSPRNAADGGALLKTVGSRERVVSDF